MIYKLKFTNDRIDWCTAKDFLHLIQQYDADYDLPIQEIESIDEISEEESKKSMVRNTEYDEDSENDMPEEFSLWELGGNDDSFAIIASTEF